MKPGKGLRRSPMPARRTPLVGSTPLQRASRLARKPMQRTRARTTREEREARRLVEARSHGLCEVCARVPATNWHHRLNASQGGAWDASNGLHVCGSGTTGCHGHIGLNRAVAYERGWSVRSTADPAATPVWLAGLGWSLLLPDGSIRPATERKSA